jgi:hypothetical protein
VVPVTFTEMMQEPFGGNVPPERLIEFIQAAAVALPPHASASAFGNATISPEGSEGQ